MTDPVREALKTAISHIEHMSAWIAKQNAGYSFESIGEDMPGLLAALSAAPGEPCAVKPLEWVDEPNREPENPAWNASNPFGLNYRIFKVWWGARDKWAFIYGSCFHHTIDEAKAAAQADYKKRIRSALVTTPQPAAGWDEAISAVINLLAKYPNRDLPAHMLAEEVEALRREAPAPADLSYVSQLIAENNELKDQLAARPDTAEARLREACRNILPYLRWTISDESPGHHPTMPSAVAQFEAALSPPSGGDDAKKSEGGVEGHAAEKRRSSTPEPEQARDEINEEGAAGIKPGPSELSPPADRREIVARIIDPDAFSMIPGQSWEALARMETQSEAQLAAKRKADAILAALAQSEKKKLRGKSAPRRLRGERPPG